MAVRKGILGKKLGMTRLFLDNGEIVPATIIEAGPCRVAQIKTVASDGYNAIQLGFGYAKRLNKPESGHLGDLPAMRYLREIRTDDLDQYERGQVVDVAVFEVGALVDIAGISKGKGFAGAMKRHGFHGGPATHGQSDRQRSVGSIGSGTTPGHVYKGMRGPGHMGNRRVTVQNLKVVQVDPERNLLAVGGAIPGSTGSLVVVQSAIKAKGVAKKRTF